MFVFNFFRFCHFRVNTLVPRNFVQVSQFENLETHHRLVAAVEVWVHIYISCLSRGFHQGAPSAEGEECRGKFFSLFFPTTAPKNPLLRNWRQHGGGAQCHSSADGWLFITTTRGAGGGSIMHSSVCSPSQKNLAGIHKHLHPAAR